MKGVLFLANDTFYGRKILLKYIGSEHEDTGPDFVKNKLQKKKQNTEYMSLNWLANNFGD